jgi:hypothetical protein
VLGDAIEAFGRERNLRVEALEQRSFNISVYRRFHEQGRLMPDGLTYVTSWVEPKLERCYQVMETADPTLLEQWMATWRDLVDFEVSEVVTSAEAAARVAPQL